MDVVAAFSTASRKIRPPLASWAEAGIGKTTPWEAAIAAACRCGYLALSSRPTANRPARSMRPAGNEDRGPQSVLATTLRECHLIAAHNILVPPTPTHPKSLGWRGLSGRPRSVMGS